MRFKQSQLLKNISRKEMNEYQKELGFCVFGISNEEMTISEMVTDLYDSLKYTGRNIPVKRFKPVEYLNLVDMRKRVILDISRCLVTAKKIGETVETGDSAKEMFDFMIKDLSLHARCLKKKAIPSKFGNDYYEASLTLYLEVCSLIRRLKVTRQGYDAIKATLGAVVCDSPKTIPTENVSEKKETKTERTVRPEHAISALPTTAAPESVEAEGENDSRKEETPESAPESKAPKTESSETGSREQKTTAYEMAFSEPEPSDEEIEPDEPVLSEEEIISRVNAYKDPYSIDDEDLLDAYMDITLKKMGIRQSKMVPALSPY